MAIQNSLDGFRNTLNVRNNSQTSRWFPLIRSATSYNWLLAVTEKGFGIIIRSRTLGKYFLPSGFESSEDDRQSALLSKVLAIDFFMANRVVKVESEVFVGMGRFTVNTSL